MIIYISGGCKNGKSSIAENICIKLKNKDENMYYIATMKPVDKEDILRIEKHRKERQNLNFETLEINKDIYKILNIANINSTFLLDSTTALLMNEMFLEDEINFKAYKKVTKDLLLIIEKLKNIVIVSDYIFSDSIEYDEITKAYRKGLAYIDKAICEKADVVLEICYGNKIIHKGIHKGKEKIGDLLC